MRIMELLRVSLYAGMVIGNPLLTPLTPLTLFEHLMNTLYTLITPYTPFVLIPHKHTSLCRVPVPVPLPAPVCAPLTPVCATSANSCSSGSQSSTSYNSKDGYNRKDEESYMLVSGGEDRGVRVWYVACH